MSTVVRRISRGTVRILAQAIDRKGDLAARPADDQWGRSESLDPDNVGDIADEGLGHRG
jgi:hypothetical protein